MPTLRSNLLEISPATIDRLLAPCRASMGSRGRCGTRPGTLLRSQIPVRTEHWDVSSSGFMEADTVAHCAESMQESFAGASLSPISTRSGPRAGRCTVRSQYTVQQRIAQIEAALPFSILGFDSDNGGEFLNWHLFDYFDKRPVPVPFTRSRAYRKNDNACVEQKNWTPRAPTGRLWPLGRRAGGRAAQRALRQGMEFFP